MSRPRIRVKHGNEYLTSHSGLVHVGTLLEATGLKERLEDLDIHCDGPTYTHSDIAFSMMGLISIGKPDYDAIEQFREKPQFFVDALGLSACPSSPTLRQRMDLMAVEQTNGLLKQESASLVWRKAPAISALETSVGQFVPLDIDVSPFDNSKTNKEGVSRTYKGYDGYAPIFAYLGTEGYFVNLEFREGKQHCQNNTPEFVRSTLNYARAITQAPILMRLDSGNDSQDNFPGPQYPNVSFIIKRNLRRESLWAWATGLNWPRKWAKKCLAGMESGYGSARPVSESRARSFPIRLFSRSLNALSRKLKCWRSRKSKWILIGSAWRDWNRKR